MNSNKKTERSPAFYARLAGFLYLVLAPLAAFGMMYVPSLIVSGDGATTAKNIMASESLVRLSIVSALLVGVGHILLGLVLYKLLKPVNKNHALFMAIFIALAAPIAMLSELNHFAVLLLLGGSNYLTTFGADQLHDLVLLFLNLREHGIFIAGIFWGLWLLPMGYLVFKSRYIPRILGVFLIIGCFGYLIDSFTFFLFPNLDVQTTMVLGLGEPLLGLWLLIKGVNVKQWEKRALESAELAETDTISTIAASRSVRPTV